MATLLSVPKRGTTAEKSRRVHGSGSLWVRKSKKHPNGIYWLRYYDQQGRQRSENAHTDSETRALKLLARRMGEAQAGILPSPRAQRTLIDDLADSYFTNYRAELFRRIGENLPGPTRAWREQNADKILSYARGRWDKHLNPVFGGRKAALVTTDDLNEYMSKRRAAGARNATVNREMSLLLRMYALGYKSKPRRVQEVPDFPEKLPEEPRRGAIDEAGFDKLITACALPGLRAMILTAYRLGFRKSELQHLLVQQIDGDWIRLFAGATKNGRSRKVPMPDDVKKAILECIAGKGPDDHVFTWRDGRPILDFRTTWKHLCKAAGVPHLRVHDLRRSAVQNMRRKGISRIVGMQITGHLTSEVFDDYDEAADQDLLEAAKVI